MTNIILHCSDSKFGNAALITKWHILERGWQNCGYHYVICNGWLSLNKYHDYFDGRLESGRPLDDNAFIDADEWGAHARGYNNSVGICLIGKSGAFTEAQKLTLYNILLKLKKQYGNIKILQHSDIDPLKPYCAGFKKRFIESLNEEL